jgi:hypothetical protein
MKDPVRTDSARAVAFQLRTGGDARCRVDGTKCVTKGADSGRSETASGGMRVAGIKIGPEASERDLSERRVRSVIKRKD